MNATTMSPVAPVADATTQKQARAPYKTGQFDAGQDPDLMTFELQGRDPEQARAEGLAGLALSGGGIRSATYSLGVLQSLNRLNLLHCFDYVSTVSGGGYIGSFWSAWRKNNPGKGVFPQSSGTSEHPTFRHLREFSNFLCPRMDLFSYDTGRMVVAPLAGMIPALATAISGLVLLFWVWALLVGRLLPSTAAESRFWFVLILSVVVVSFEIAWLMRDGALSKSDYRWVYWALAAAVIGVGVFIWPSPAATSAVFGHTHLPWLADVRFKHGVDLNREFSSDLQVIRHLYAPAIVVAILLGGVIALRFLISRLLRIPERVAARSAFDRLLSRLLLLVAFWSIFATLWLAGAALLFMIEPERDTGLLGALTTALTTIFVWARRFMSKRPSAATNGRRKSRVSAVAIEAVAWAAVVLIALLVVISLQYAHAHPRAFVPTLMVSGTIFLLAWFLFHPNRLSLHAFYRGRLARAYLGGGGEVTQSDEPQLKIPSRVTEEQPQDDFPLVDMRSDKPMHLVCCAANNLAPREPLPELERGAVSAVLSPVGFSVGQKWRTWGADPTPTLGAAMTASGAAFNSLMGAYSKKFGLGSTFLMAALNLRLGLWLRHPHCSSAKSMKDWGVPGRLFLSELVGFARITDKGSVHLSDGGHFDNTAVYELIRRRCRFILLCDCGADPDFNFDDIGNLVRKAREDFRAEITLDLSPLRPVDGVSRQPMVAGDIRYHDQSTGVFLILKPTLIGSEPADVTQYKKRNDAFPAETTGDQFYDEAQWEAYRRLGEFAADTAFGFATEPRIASLLIDRNDGASASGALEAVFARARFDWLPMPPDRGARVAKLSQRAAEMERMLAEVHGGGFLDDVFKELGDVKDKALQPASRAAASEAESAAALQVARRALSFMEEVFYEWQLETTSTQPQNLGAVNYIARWAYAPPVRDWWPILKSMHSPAFIRFMEGTFTLPSGEVDAEPLARIKHGDSGFAFYCWSSMPHPKRTALNEMLLEFRTRLWPPSQHKHTVQVGLLRCFEERDELIWHVDDFFIPPGLWGMGIGQRFLRELVKTGKAQFPRVKRFRVLLEKPDQSQPADQKAAADAAQLYRSAGFRDQPCGADLRKELSKEFELKDPTTLVYCVPD